MFSCVLVRTSEGSEDALTAEAVSLDVQLVSEAGRGAAECRYVLEKGSKDLVACVPSSISAKGGSRQLLKVTSCLVESQTAGHSVQTASLHLSKLDSEYSEQARTLPSYASIKKSLKRPIAPEDLILHLGHFEANSIIVLKFEFLVQLRAPDAASPSPSSLSYTFANNFSAKRFLYKLRLAAHTHIVDASPTDTTVPLTNFSWFHTDRTKQVIQVSYEVTQLEDAMETSNSADASAAFKVEVGGERARSLQPVCCSCLVQTNSRHACAEEETEYDGIMMLSSRVSGEQLLSLAPSLPSPPSCHSEFVFLVDCSASMNPFIDSVIATLITCVKSLPKECYFNLIAFGSNFRQLFHESKEYSKTAVKHAVDFANQLKASLGGTELLPPLKWIYKTSRKSEMPCQVFVITDVDQEVKDVPYMLSTIKKHRHYARCHTFGIGSSICESLVTSIAEVSGGRSIILREGERLQTKVMEVLKDSLRPFLMDTRIRWRPPRGYVVADSTPKSLGTLFPQHSHLSFAFLRKKSQALYDNNNAFHHSHPPATIVGSLGGREVEIPAMEATLPSLTAAQSSDLSSVLTQVGRWSKLEELEIARLQAVSRKNSVEDEDADTKEPKAKRPRLNGETNGVLPTPSEIQKELLELSLRSGIPSPFTFFQGRGETTAATAEDTDRQILQLLPFKQPSSANANSLRKYRNGMVASQRRKHRRRQEQQQQQQREKEQQEQERGSVVSRTISAVSSSFMNLVNMFHTDTSSIDGKTIDDELELQRQKGSQLILDDSSGKIKYPSSYYMQNASTTQSSDKKGVLSNHHHHHKNHHHHHHHHRHAAKETALVGVGNKNGNGRHLHHLAPAPNGHCYRPPSTGPGGVTKTHTHAPPSSISNSTSTSITQPPPTRYVLDTSSSSDDEEDIFTISDSESDTSVELDWDSLPKTREYLPMIQMQLFSGAWPMIHEFSYAVRVPFGEIGKLPLLNQQKPETESSKKPSPSLPPANSCLHELDHEDRAHFWTTVLAVACFRECFPELREEWELVVRKGERWLEENLHQCSLSNAEVQAKAKELLSRKS